MLVLSRKTGEKIVIQGIGVITIVRIGPNNVRVGLEFPKELNIVRGELLNGQENEALSYRGTSGDAGLV
jgi:carbon storage regulator